MAAARQVSSHREGTDLSSNISNSHTELSFMPATATQRGGHNNNSSRDTTLKVRKCRSGAIREGRRLRHLRRPLPTRKVMGISPDKDISSRDTTGTKLRPRHLRSARDILSIGRVLSSSNSSSRDSHTNSRVKVLQGLGFPSIVRANSSSKTDGNLPSSNSSSNSKEAVAPRLIQH